MTMTDHHQEKEEGDGERRVPPEQKKKLGGLANLQTSPWCPTCKHRDGEPLERTDASFIFAFALRRHQLCCWTRSCRLTETHSVSVGGLETKYQERKLAVPLNAPHLPGGAVGVEEGGSMRRKEAECMAMPSPSLSGRTGPDHPAWNKISHTASPFPPPLPSHTSFLASSHDPKHPRPLDKQ